MKMKPYYMTYLLFVLFFFAYYPVIYDLRDSVMGNELAHHSPLVLALTVYLVYRRRESLVMRSVPPALPGSPVLLMVGLLFNLLGQAGGVYYLSQLSIPLTVYGMAFFIAGKQFARHLIFPLLFLLLAFPIPGKVYMDVVFPLKLLVTQVSGAILQFIGYPVRIYGNILEISSLWLGVADACSGLNSLMMILTLSIYFSHLLIKRWHFRLIIVFFMLPLIMITNILRVATTAVVALHWGPEAVEGKLHSLWGIAVFAAAALGLMAVTKVFMIWENRTSVD